MDWLKILATEGDPIEKEGVALGIEFPRYAEFWRRYVYPNRDPQNPSKLKKGFPSELEQLINSHYSVWYHLTVAFRQIEGLDNDLVDPSDPFFHLASAIDLIERTFVIAANLENGTPIAKRMTKEAYDQKTQSFWNEHYSKGFEKFLSDAKPVEIKLHSTGIQFSQCVSKSTSRRNFNRIAKKIREYRNILTHNPPLVRVVQNESIYLPVPDYLRDYKAALWSSNPPNPQHFKPVKDLISEMAVSLVESANELWSFLLTTAEKITDLGKFSERLITITADPNTTYIPESNCESGSVTTYAGGTADYPLQNVKPSGLHFIPPEETERHDDF
ncbi:MAG: hypothetical protein JXN59_02765 [Anaerolineae bacterium]|nr:hypothetical protein [Anaerolineae bacterium]